VHALPEFPRGHAFVIVPAQEGLSTRDVYAASTPNPAFRAVEGELIRRMHTVRLTADVAALMANDLEPAALRLRPGATRALDALRAAGALRAQVTGSGPTAFGLFPHRAAAEEAAAGIPGALAASPV
jgi:4-diphosphocytidyl-2-C-methyl-D-erythritol kinase